MLANIDPVEFENIFTPAEQAILIHLEENQRPVQVIEIITAAVIGLIVIVNQNS